MGVGNIYVHLRLFAGTKIHYFHGIDAVKSFLSIEPFVFCHYFPVATNIFVHGISFGQNRIIIYDRISVIIPPQPPTLWFVSMIILFYYLSPSCQDNEYPLCL